MNLKSTFENNGKIPPRHTCAGEDIRPYLEITDIPPKAKTLAIIVDDPDAPAKTWVHWVVWNIPVTGKTVKLPEGEEVGTQGMTDFSEPEWGGPCPPFGTHRYFFRAYALDTILSLKEGSKKSDVEKAMYGHILARAELVGLFSKR